MQGLARGVAVVLIGVLSGCQIVQDVENLVTSGVDLVTDQFSSKEDVETEDPAPEAPQSANITSDSITSPETQPMTTSGILPQDAVVDGDTIHLSGRKIRLHGIDAPELSQFCTASGREVPCGVIAKNALIGFTAGAQVRCIRKDIDRYGRDVSQCYSGEVDVSAAMVSSGMAVAYRKYSLEYVAYEEIAIKGRKGMWKGAFIMPWEWRAKRKQQ